MNGWEVAKEAEEVKYFRPVNGETHTLFDQQVLGSRSKYSRVNKRYVNPLIHLLPLNWGLNKPCLKKPHTYISSDLTIFVPSAILHRGTEIPVQVHMVDSNTPLTITALIDLGATGQFIDIEYIQSKNLQVQHLPRAIPVYNGWGSWIWASRTHWIAQCCFKNICFMII